MGTFVAVGGIEAGVGVGEGAYSTDGINWISAELASWGWADLWYGDDLFVAVTQEATMLSPDGINWTFNDPGIPSNYLPQKVRYGVGIWVAVGNYPGGHGFVLTSLDAQTWTLNADPDTDLPLKALGFGNGRFIAVSGGGADDRLVTSTDGLSWTPGTILGTTPGTHYGWWQAMAYSPSLDRWVIVGYDLITGPGTFGTVATSDDGGLTWTQRACPDVCYDDIIWDPVLEQFVTVGSPVMGPGSRPDGICTSPDGITWTLRTVPTDARPYKITVGDGLYVAVGDDSDSPFEQKIITSPDGITWTKQTAPLDGSDYFMGVAFKPGDEEPEPEEELPPGGGVIPGDPNSDPETPPPDEPPPDPGPGYPPPPGWKRETSGGKSRLVRDQEYCLPEEDPECHARTEEAEQQLTAEVEREDRISAGMRKRIGRRMGEVEPIDYGEFNPNDTIAGALLASMPDGFAADAMGEARRRAARRKRVADLLAGVEDEDE